MLAYLFFFIVKLKFFNNFYDSKSMEGLTNILTQFPYYFRLKSFQNFYLYVLNDYYLLVLLAVITFVFLAATKKYWQALLMCFFLVGVWFVITINYANGTSQFYVESQYLILVIFVAMPFAYFVIEHALARPFAYFVVVAAMALSLIRISATANIYRERLDYIREVSNSSFNKRIMPYEKIDSKKLMFTWGISFEVWLISTLETGKTHSVIYEERDHQFEDQLSKQAVFITLMGIYDYAGLNNLYFKKDSVEVYSRY